MVQVAGFEPTNVTLTERVASPSLRPLGLFISFSPFLKRSPEGETANFSTPQVSSPSAPRAVHNYSFTRYFFSAQVFFSKKKGYPLALNLGHPFSVSLKPSSCLWPKTRPRSPTAWLHFISYTLSSLKLNGVIFLVFTFQPPILRGASILLPRISF